MKRIILFVLSLLLSVGCSNRLPDFSTIEQQFYTGLERSPVTLTSFGKQLGGKIVSPKYDGSSVDASVEINGYVKQYQRQNGQYMWIQVTFEGEQNNQLSKIFEYYTELKQGEFTESIRLFAGLGEYHVKIFAPSNEKAHSYYLFSEFDVTNQNSDIQADVTYTLLAKKRGLQLSSPTKGYQSRKDSILLSGSLNKSYAEKQVLLQVLKGNKKWQKVIKVSKEATFQETVPLLYGEGVHQIEVLLPDENRSNYFLSGAKFYVYNQTRDSHSPIQYSAMYEQRGIHLTTPIAGGGQGEYFYRVKGYLDPHAEQVQETTHLIVQTKKNGLLATYFVPIKHFSFDSKIPLRFGAGDYDVIVYVPEITKQKRDYFRFFMVAKFQVKSFADKDKRDLLPSRGIEPDNPKIRKLAKAITAGAGSDYDRSRLIYRYVAKNMNYDVGKFEQNGFAWDDSALKSLKLKRGVCQDYVFLTLSLLRSLNISSRFIEGIANGQNHAWVEAKINGDWLVMDPTWGSGYMDSSKQFIKHYDRSFFDIPKKKLEKTHKRTGIVY